MSGHRRSVHLLGYDYGLPGFYFITLCTYDRACLFGRVVDDAIDLSPEGQIVSDEWIKTPIIRPNVELDEWQIMPDHFHAIIRIKEIVGAAGKPPYPSREMTLHHLVNQFKAAVTKQIRLARNDPHMNVWQRGYYERIIRNEDERELVSDMKVKYRFSCLTPTFSLYATRACLVVQNSAETAGAGSLET